MKVVNSIFLYLIHAYRVVASPTLGGACRFHPSCSVYAQEAFKTWGPARACYLTIKRVISCRPGGKFGYDPVPENHKDKDIF